MSDKLVIVDNASKKFCSRFRRSLWYGVKDLSSELIGRANSHKDLRKDEFWAVRNVSFEVYRGESLGLIGHNGAGKTTLMRMLHGLIKIDVGRIEVRGRMQALIALGAGFNPILTGRENVYINAAVLGITKKEVDRRFDEIVDFSGVEEFIDSPVQSYSSGMAVRLGFAVAVHVKPDILLVDEVLAVGDWGFQKKCYNKIGELKKNGTAIILVSHNMQVMTTFAEKGILMKHGEPAYFDNIAEAVKEYNGNFTNNDDLNIERINEGTDKIKFTNIEINQQKLHPGDSFVMSLQYESLEYFPEVQIDTKIICTNEPGIYFQAINKAYDKTINLQRGRHILTIKAENIQINNANATISISIWAKNKAEILFWWRIPLEFDGIDYSVGKNYLNMTYETYELN